MLVYITGAPGSGKSTLCAEFRARGYPSVDADLELGVWLRGETRGTLLDPPPFDVRAPEFYEQHEWRYRADGVRHLARSSVEAVCFVSGFAAGDDELSHLFDRSFFLHVEADELRRRLLTRTNAPFANASRAVREAQVQRVLPNLAALEQGWLARGVEIVSETPGTEGRRRHPAALRPAAALFAIALGSPWRESGAARSARAKR